MTQKLLLQKSSGCVYHYTESLAADPDFVEYKKAAPKAEPKPAPIVEPVAEPAPAPDAKTMARAVLTKRK